MPSPADPDPAAPAPVHAPGEDRARLDAMLRAAGMVGWEWDVQGDAVRFIGDIAGLTGADAWNERMRLAHFVHPEDLTSFAETLRACWLDDAPYQQEFRIVRRNGEVRWVADVGRPSVMTDGRRWLSGVLTDVTARMEAEDAARQSRARLDYALTAAGMTAWDWDPETGMVFHTADLNPNPVGRIEDRAQLARLMHPDDRARVAEAFERAFFDGTDYRQEYRILRPDGRYYWVASVGRALAGPDGRRRMSGVVTDIHARKTAQLHRDLLVNELNHRVKNTLAVIQGVAAQTFRGRDDAAARLFQGRLLALSTAHNVLTRESWESAGLREIVEDAVRPFCPRDAARRITASGPDLRTPAKTALALAMALHELGANAVKYGALSTPEGAVDLCWSGEDGRLRMTWSERGGPPVTPPERRGFGSRMIERGLAAELGGTVKVLFRPEGVLCHVDAPLPRPAAPDREHHA